MWPVIRMSEVTDFVRDNVIHTGRRSMDQFWIEDDRSVLERASPALLHRFDLKLWCEELPVPAPLFPSHYALLELFSGFCPIPSMEGFLYRVIRFLSDAHMQIGTSE